ncbi:MAG: UpxY family transcription antiterminator [Bacteroidota bacterium]|nr:UpxY family transcription antiterminator [Bacteroidota bacterium]
MNWIALYTRSRHEQSVARQLTLYGIESFVPMRKELHKWSDRKRLVDVPLMPSYVFAYLPLNEHHQVFGVPGIVRIVMFNKRVAIVNPSEIELLRKVCRTENPVSVKTLKFCVKDEVEIISGLFAGYRGTVVQFGKNYKVGIQIKEIDYSVVVDVSHDQIRSYSEVPVLN